MSLCILIPLIVGVISAILGYLLGKSLGGNSISPNENLSLQSDLDACRATSSKLNANITSLQAEIAALKSKASSNIQSFTSNPVSTIPFDASLAATVFGKKIKQDDLKIIEGIGPKIEELYHAAGIKTWKALSETSTEKSKVILDEAGDRFAIHNPTTWAKQALLAYVGKWQELKDWQNSLNGGKE
jgi:predicted flap endonuclease-1-like 5' DNA nuclease